MAKNARIKLKAEDKTKAGIASAQKNLRDLKATAINVTGALAAVGTALGGAFIAKQAEVIRIQTRMADQIGITTEKFGALSYAITNEAEVSQEQFNDIMQEFVTRIGDAQSGTQSIIEAYTALGLSAKDLADLKTDEAFLKVVDALSQLNDKTKQQFLLEEIFAGESAKLRPILDNNASAMKRLIDQADDLGILYSREQAEEIIQTQKALTNLGAALEGVGTSAFAAVVSGGDFPEWINSITESLISLRKWIDENKESIFSFFQKAFSFTPQAYGLKVAQAYIDKIKELLGVQSQLNESGQSSGDLTVDVTRDRGRPNLPILDETEFSKALGDENTMLSAYGDYLKALNDQAQEEADRFNQIWGNAFNTFSSGIGNAVADAIMDQASLGDALQQTMRATAKSVISTIVQIGVQKATLFALEKAGMISSVATTKLAAGTLAGVWSPAATLAATATLGTAATTGAASIAAAIATTKGLSLIDGQMHDGGMVPRTGTYFLEKGEKVVPRKEVSQSMGAMSVTFQISAMDTQNATEFLMRNESKIVDMVQKAYDSRGKDGGPVR